jgi:hypothetical protein
VGVSLGNAGAGRRSWIALGIVAASSLPLTAQYLGDQQLGLTGLKAGSQPTPGLYITLPLYYRAGGISIYDSQGNQVAKNATANLNVFVLPAIQVVTPFKILGATYGAGFLEWISNGVIDQATLDLHRSTSYGFADLYVSPLILGWHLKQADITAGYSFFAPVGPAGFHQWVNEIDFGTTLYPDVAKRWNLSTMMYYDFNQGKNNKDVKVGNVLTLSGGLGRSFKGGLINAGAAYAAQWKITHDRGSDIPNILSITNGRAFGAGPELDTPVFAKGKYLGLVSFRYLWNIGPKTALGGQLLSVSFTLARLGKL